VVVLGRCKCVGLIRDREKKHRVRSNYQTTFIFNTLLIYFSLKCITVALKMRIFRFIKKHPLKRINQEIFIVYCVSFIEYDLP
jgi:hypothetical protein